MTDRPPGTTPHRLGGQVLSVSQGSRLSGRRHDAPSTGRAAVPEPVAATAPGQHVVATHAHETAQRVCAGPGFTRPGPSAEVPRGLYRAALQDALAYTTDRDGCGDCDWDQLCETHTARTARARQYQDALDEELEAAP
jgi:hypothetical protein